MRFNFPALREQNYDYLGPVLLSFVTNTTEVKLKCGSESQSYDGLNIKSIAYNEFIYKHSITFKQEHLLSYPCPFS